MINDFINSSFDRKRSCVGCSACEKKCPVNAIAMIRDSEGFLYPKIDKNKCIRCNLCDTVCIFKNEIKYNRNKEFFYGFSNDNDIVNRSSSGGIFYEIAHKCLRSGFIVYGVGYDTKDNLAKYLRIEDSNNLFDILKSKYIQASTENTYLLIKNDLDDKKNVLVVGTPCFCNSLKLFLKKDYENLFIIDFICHGVPSPLIWLKYIKEYNYSDISEVDFRDKTYGWNAFGLRLVLRKKVVRQSRFKNVYFRLFLNDIILRPSCYHCPAKCEKRCSDLTLGDLWGAKKICSNTNNDGMSIIITNNKKGEFLLDNINASIYTGSENLLKYNKAYNDSAKMPNFRETFFKYYKDGYSLKKLKKFTKFPIKLLIKDRVSRILRKR